MTTPARHFVIATAGHVDHGKSTLVRALTGTDPDRLPEEKRRGMTIDLGFARLLLPTQHGTTLQVGLVDVPGHEDFVKNMVAGVGAVDAALLVIAADDGPMPQTLEHLQILTYLGVRRGVIALTKSDLSPDTTGAIAGVRKFLRDSSMAEAPIIPVSARNGSGMDALRLMLVDVLTAAPDAADYRKPRLAIDRAFSVRGSGTVVTGTLTGGSLSRGQAVLIQPSGAASRVRDLQSHGASVDRVEPGTRVAINLTDVHPAGDTAVGSTVGRGDWVAASTEPRPSLILDAQLFTAMQPTEQPPSLRDGLTVKLHLGTAAVPARLQWDSDRRRFARLRLSRPVLAMVGDRFVLRSVSDRHTLAGGVVLDAMVSVRRRRSFVRDASQHALLASRSASPGDRTIAIRSALDRDRVADCRTLFATLPHREEELAEACNRLVDQGVLHEAGASLVRSEEWTLARRAVQDAVMVYHRTHPQQQGLPLHDVRQSILQSLGLPRVSTLLETICDAVIKSVAADQIVRTGTVLRHTSHQPALPPRLQAAGQVILGALRDRPFDPPSSKELIRTDAHHQALKYLIATGQVVDVGQHVVLAADAFAAAIDQIRHQLSITGSATVSELKAALGSSRRVMVPLLERLDKDHVTRRQGDQRFLA